MQATPGGTQGLRAIVLGSAAGGGLPQWNCACTVCRRSRAGDTAVPGRTQTGLAVSADGRRWVLVNASPDLRGQIEATPALHANGTPRGSPIAGVVLTAAEIDAIAGLLVLREGHAFAMYGSAEHLWLLDGNPMFRALPPQRVPRRMLPLQEDVALTDAAGEPLGITVEAFAVTGKPPLFTETGDPPAPTHDGTTIGLRITGDGGGTLAFIPGCAGFTEALRRHLQGVDVLLFDGTLWQDDELQQTGTGTKTGRRMGHMSLNGPDGTLAGLRDLDAGRRILIHINNTNPILMADSPERHAVTQAGWEVAYDGMEIRL
ncbi:MAG: pyrroloquinoline quinone biosynthesis protein PqqB [Acetobacteraceae bacterium]